MKEVLGKGGFGRVMKVMYKKDRKIYAMKEMSKTVYLLPTNLVSSPKKAFSQFLMNVNYSPNSEIPFLSI